METDDVKAYKRTQGKYALLPGGAIPQKLSRYTRLVQLRPDLRDLLINEGSIMLANRRDLNARCLLN